MGIRDNLRGLNIIGLKRKGLNQKNIQKVQIIFKKIFKKNQSLEKNIEDLSVEEKSITEIQEIIQFISSNLKKGICRFQDE